jgi:hypothetical protein
MHRRYLWYRLPIDLDDAAAGDAADIEFVRDFPLPPLGGPTFIVTILRVSGVTQLMPTPAHTQRAFVSHQKRFPSADYPSYL